VDVLSRPVSLVETRSKRRLAETVSQSQSPGLSTEDELNISNEDDDMQVDPHEVVLRHYLKFKRQIRGASKQQCKRVLKAAARYRLDKDAPEKGELRDLNPNKCPQTELVVPSPEQRRLICERAHLLGHFQVNTTLNRVQENYYLPRIKQDVERVVRNCLPCKRHQPQPKDQHPAIALPITGLMDRVGIDVIGGLLETACGYVGITEYLSKYPYAVPIRSKTATEIA
jgi:hypothetical protein